ncbi:HNH endonuclease signature motif containing protein [Streptomyces sp. NPDC006975]|uniref:HNH endonuclease signature motif containing protein n=1 Tax=Streptomyces sp. NPDC006975 TaxID=3154310 RepID=UPI003453E49C
MALTDITQTAVEKAIEEYDRLGRDAFLKRYGFQRARRYLLVHHGGHYDSKAIAGAAHGHLPGQRPLMAREFSGGARHVARVLRGLGFEVMDDHEPDRPGHQDQPEHVGPTVGPEQADLPQDTLSRDELVRRITRLAVNRASGRPALYKPITLLWAMGRARRGEPRLLPWTRTEEALAELLRRHGMRGERPRPDYPVASLCRDRLWTLPDHPDGVPSAHGDATVRRWFAEHQPRGGLADPVYDVLRHSAVTRLAVIDALLDTFFDDLDAAPLLADVGLDEAEATDPTAGAGREPEQWLVTAAEYERGCRLLEEREAAVHGERVARVAHRHRRSRAARYLVLARSGGRCENPRCTGQPDDMTDRRQPILEVDHVVDLALGGRDHPSQMVALCPNCHAVKTRGSTRDTLRELLLKVALERHSAARR